jgi:large subunit ribosomal protein L15
MGTTLDKLSPPRGAKHAKKRLGRGTSSGHGSTAGKGVKGQGARSGVKRVMGWFEGGQMPLQRRLPKRGFKNPFRIEFEAVNVGELAKRFSAGEVADPETLKARGLVPRKCKLVKILGEGELPHALTVKAHAFSKVALEKITSSGGATEIIPSKRKVEEPAVAVGEHAGETGDRG